MEEKKMTMARWLATATAGIRFGPDRAAAEEELRAHMEDKIADFQRFFPDITEEEAVQRAVSEMGDAREIGKELAHIHRPWLGYLWTASKWALWVVTALACWMALTNWPSLWPASSGDSWLGERGMPGYFRSQLGEERAVDCRDLPLPEARTVGEYTFTLDRAELWTAAKGGEVDRMVYLVLEDRYRRPWEELRWDFGEQLWAEDDRGNRIKSEREWTDESPKTLEQFVQSGNPLEVRAFGMRREFIIPLPDPEAEVLTLRYDRMGADLTIPILLKEGAQ